MTEPLVLLVDDIPDHVVTYAAALAEDGFRVAVASRGNEALATARSIQPDCIVIDVRLPDMSGWELCRALKSADVTKHTPVIVLTADASRSYAAESLAVRCDAWIAQPSMPEDLVRAVRDVLQTSDTAPSCAEAAFLNGTSCPMCESDEVRATVRVSPSQYYTCRACRHVWRVEAR
jgi:CheY-like chemotaxis protein